MLKFKLCVFFVQPDFYLLTFHPFLLLKKLNKRSKVRIFFFENYLRNLLFFLIYTKKELYYYSLFLNYLTVLCITLYLYTLCTYRYFNNMSILCTGIGQNNRNTCERMKVFLLFSPIPVCKMTCKWFLNNNNNMSSVLWPFSKFPSLDLYWKAFLLLLYLKLCIVLFLFSKMEVVLALIL